MVVMYFCVRVVGVGHAFVCYGNRCSSCICVLGVSMFAMYLCVRVIDVGRVFWC